MKRGSVLSLKHMMAPAKLRSEECEAKSTRRSTCNANQVKQESLKMSQGIECRDGRIRKNKNSEDRELIDKAYKVRLHDLGKLKREEHTFVISASALGPFLWIVCTQCNRQHAGQHVL